MTTRPLKPRLFRSSASVTRSSWALCPCRKQRIPSTCAATPRSMSRSPTTTWTRYEACGPATTASTARSRFTAASSAACLHLPRSGNMIMAPADLDAMILFREWSRVMHKLVVLYRQPADPDHFRDYYVTNHLPLVESWPGLLAWRYSFDVAATQGETPYFAVFEADFTDAAAMAEARASRQGQQVAADAANYATGGAVVIHYPVQDGTG